MAQAFRRAQGNESGRRKPMRYSKKPPARNKHWNRNTSARERFEFQHANWAILVAETQFLTLTLMMDSLHNGSSLKPLFCR